MPVRPVALRGTFRLRRDARPLGGPVRHGTDRPFGHTDHAFRCTHIADDPDGTHDSYNSYKSDDSHNSNHRADSASDHDTDDHADHTPRRGDPGNLSDLPHPAGEYVPHRCDHIGFPCLPQSRRHPDE